MPWWAWVVVGCVFAGIEIAGADLAFYFIFLGVAALVVGLVQLGGGELALWEQWLLFAGLAMASMVLFRKRLYARLRAQMPGFDNTPAGEVIRVGQDLAVGERTRVELRGSRWTATNVGAGPIAADSPARVVGTRGAGLTIEAVGPNEVAGETAPGGERTED